MTDTTDTRCPVCGAGTLVEITHDTDPTTREPVQRPESLEMLEFTCGHRAPGASLATAEEDRLSVERRTSEETVDPGPADD